MYMGNLQQCRYFQSHPTVTGSIPVCKDIFSSLNLFMLDKPLRSASWSVGSDKHKIMISTLNG